jgi:hypothetical protein
MGRPAKVTKHSLLIALSHSLSIAQAARHLAVDRHTVYDAAAKRFGVDFSTAFQRFSTPYPSLEASEPSSLPLEQSRVAKSASTSSGDVRRFALADYTGPYLGDVSESRGTGLLNRYHRLRGK